MADVKALSFAYEDLQLFANLLVDMEERQNPSKSDISARETVSVFVEVDVVILAQVRVNFAAELHRKGVEYRRFRHATCCLRSEPRSSGWGKEERNGV